MTDVPSDDPLLVCYDYGTGGLWGVLMAPSVAAITAKYPELDIVDKPPAPVSDPERKTIVA